MEFFLFIIIIILAYLLYKAKKNQDVNISGSTKQFGYAIKEAANTFKDSMNKNSIEYKTYIHEIFDFIKMHNEATKGLILSYTKNYKNDICSEDFYRFEF